MEDELVIPSTVRDLVEQRMGSPEWNELNLAERAMAELPQIPCPLEHVFTPVPGHPGLNLYARQITMYAGMIVTSRIHMHEHPFIISSGTVSVWSNENGWETFTAPFQGLTKPGARRVLYMHTDVVWTTFHVTKQTDPDKVVEEVTYPHMRLGHMDDVSPDKLATVQANAMTPTLIK